MKKIGLLDIKAALQDERFRDTLPEEMKKAFKDMSCSSCPANTSFYQRILLECRSQLQEYFPAREVANIKEENKKLAENHWTIINCHIDDLESNLKKLPPGRKQLDLSRYDDQVTVIINEIDILY
jgi:hypothetical protein